jgi:hypothetical protein
MLILKGLRAMRVIAILLALFVVAANAAPLNCNVLSDNVALARVVTTQARLNFLAGRDKRTHCPSPERSCKLKAFLIPGDEVLISAMKDPYVCATYKLQTGIATTGFLLRAALQIVSPDQGPAQKWDGTWRRDSEAEIVIKSRDGEVKVSV